MFIPVFTTKIQTFLIDQQENGLRNCEIATKQNTMPTLKIAIMQKCLRYNIKQGLVDRKDGKVRLAGAEGQGAAWPSCDSPPSAGSEMTIRPPTQG